MSWRLRPVWISEASGPILPEMMAFDLQHVAGALSSRLCRLIDGVLHALGNFLPHVRGDDLFLGQHYRRGLVDLVHPKELILAGAGVHGGFRAGGRRRHCADLFRLCIAFGRRFARQLSGVCGPSVI